MKRTTLALAGALALFSAGASFAQQPPPSPRPGGPPPRMMQRHDPAQMAAHHAQHLRDALQLTPAQEPALKAFLEASHAPMGGPDRMGRDGRPDQPMTTPQRLDRQRARMTERMAQFDRHAAALKRFYGALTPTQQKAFDAMGPMGGRGHRGMRGHGGPRGGPHGPGGAGGHGGPGGGHDHHD